MRLEASVDDVRNMRVYMGHKFEEVNNVIWADDVTGEYAIYIKVVDALLKQTRYYTDIRCSPRIRFNLMAQCVFIL